MRILLLSLLVFLTACTHVYTSDDNNDLKSANNIQQIYIEFINNPKSLQYSNEYWLNKQYTQEEINKAKETYELYK